MLEIKEKFYILKRINPEEELCEVLENNFFDTYNEAFKYYTYSRKTYEDLYIRQTKEGKVNLKEPILNPYD